MKTFLVKGEISGIQDFIFAVPNQIKRFNSHENIPIARFLKGRSLFIEYLPQVLLKSFKGLNPKKNLIAGGNFEIELIETEDNLQKTYKEFQQSFFDSKLPLSFYMAWIEKEEGTNQNKELNQKLQIAKKQIFQLADYESIFRPYCFCKEKAIAQVNNFAELADDFAKSGQIDFSKDYTKSLFCDFGWLNEALKAQLKGIPLGNNDLIEWTKGEIPEGSTLEENKIIDFDCLGLFAKKRTGSDNIACLTVDVDNLGELKRNFNKEKLEKLSGTLIDFFTTGINDLLQKEFESGSELKTKYQDNIYVVFSGGDDFIAIGAWDALFDFASKLKCSFDLKINCDYPELTLSAGLVIAHSKFPVARLAPLANQAEKKAKNFKNSESEGRNAICLFDEVFTWKEFNKIICLKNQIDQIINLSQDRSIIDKVRRSCIGFEKLQDKALEGKFEPPQVWRLAYFLRDGTKEGQGNKLERLIHGLIKTYESLILETLMKKNKTNPMIFPVAARWAELESKLERSEKNGQED